MKLITPNVNFIKKFILFLLFFTPLVFATSIVNLKGSLSANAGVLNYNLSLNVPTGIAGVAPQISLSYTSGVGNGFLGQGWNVSGLSSISRCGSNIADDGYGRSVKFDSKDNYCLGGQRLIKIDEEEYRTQIESYSKIIRHGDASNPTSFTVMMKSGDIYTYASVEKLANFNIKWFVSKIEDRFSNSINFYYSNDRESKRIERITYANNKNIIKFNYSSKRKDKWFGYKKGSLISLSKQLSSISISSNRKTLRTYQLSYYYQLSELEKLKLRSIKECNLENECTNPLSFKWQGQNQFHPKFSASLRFPNNNVEAYHTKLADLNGDGLIDIYVVQDDSDAVYLNNRNGFYLQSQPDIRANVEDINFLDLDGDGDIDIYEVDGGDDNIWLNDGKGNFHESSHHPSISVNSKNIRFIDIDSDGDIDIYYTKFGKGYLFQNNGTAIFTSKGVIHRGVDTYLFGKVAFHDFNDDGYLDIIHILREQDDAKGVLGTFGFMVHLNQGDGTFSDESKIEVSSIYEGSLVPGFRSRGYGETYFSDFNGDGLLDILFLRDTENLNSYGRISKLYLGKDTGTWEEHDIEGLFAEKKDIELVDINGDGYIDILKKAKGHLTLWKNKGDSTFVTTSLNIEVEDMKELKFADINGDGLVDMYKVNEEKDDEIWLNINGFSFTLSNTKTVLKSESEFIQLIDMNGDSFVDIVDMQQNATIYLNQNQAMVMREVKDSFENKITINYKYLTDESDFYTKDNTRIGSVINLQTPMYLVSDITYHDKRIVSEENQNNVDVYKYKGLKFDLLRGPLGFREISVKNLITNNREDSIFYQFFPLVGNVKSSKVYLEKILLAQNDNQMEVLRPYLDKKRYVLRVKKEKADTYSKSGEYIKTVVTDYHSYDLYGNILSMTTMTTDGLNKYSKTTNSKYKNYIDNWILGRLSYTKVVHQGGDESSKERTSSFRYYKNGMLKSETIEPNHRLNVTKTFVYDNYGNIIEEDVSSPTINGGVRINKYIYDQSGKFLLRSVNPLGHTNQKDTRYNKATGEIISQTNENGRTTSWLYDAWGRVKQERRIDGTITKSKYNFDTRYMQDSYGESLVNQSQYSIEIITTGLPSVKTYYDSLDRKIRVETQRFDGEVISSDYYYDVKGQLSAQTVPHTEEETNVFTEYKYDELGRKIETIFLSPRGDLVSTHTIYDGLTVKTIDAKYHEKSVKHNILDQVIEVEEEMDGTLAYKYDSMGNLIKTIPNGDSSYAVTMRYDILGNKIFMKDPNMGSWYYFYDVLGNLISQTDAKGQITRIVYDKLNRKVKRINDDGESIWIYDTAYRALGKLSVEKGHGIEKRYRYHNKNEKLLSVETYITGTNKWYKKSYFYRADGKLEQDVMRSNGGTSRKILEKIYTYNELGFLMSVKSPIQRLGDFDIEHFKILVEKTLAMGLENYKKSLEFTYKANKYKRMAEYYGGLAKRYREGSEERRKKAVELKNYAEQLRVNALVYESYGNKYKKDFLYQKNLVKKYLILAEKYKGINKGKTYRDLASKHQKYANFYKTLSKEYLERVKIYNNVAHRYDGRSETYLRAAEYYIEHGKNALRTAEKFYDEASEFDKQAQYYLKEGKGADSREISDAYKEMISDANKGFLYHYKVLSQNSQGQVTKYISGNGLVTRNNYNDSGVMKSSSTGYSFDSNIRESSYEYDYNFNLLSSIDNELKLVQVYSYDKLDRLSSSSIFSSTMKKRLFNYAYDIYGNLTQKNEKRISYKYGTNKVSSVNRDSSLYSYDENGNMLKSGSNEIEYNVMNKPIRIHNSEQDIFYSYDMNGNRYKKSENGKETYYIGKEFEDVIYRNKVKESKNIIYVGGKVVSIYTESNKNPKGFYLTRFLHYNSLGSIDTITDYGGHVVQRLAYKPFGEQIEEVKLEDTTVNRGYTGHEHIEGTKLIHMNARVYDPTIGRFLSADTFIQDPYDTQSYNRYSYVRNNPLKYTDPTGHFWGIGTWLKHHKSEIVGFIAFGPGSLLFTSNWTKNYVATHAWTQAVGSIVAGFYGGPFGAAAWSSYTAYAQGGSFNQIAGAGLTAGVTAGFMSAIGNSGQIIGNNYGVVANYASRAVLHGGLGAFSSASRGGSWSSGFWSGSLGTVLAPLANTGNYYGNIASNAIIGGTISRVTGGKFANGAVMGAFRYMFNDALEHGNHIYLSNDIDKKDFDKSTSYLRGLHPKSFYVYAHGKPTEIYQTFSSGKMQSFYGADVMLDLLKNNGYTEGQSIVLFACSTGLKPDAGGESFAQLLSNNLNVSIYAPEGYLVIPPNGGRAYISNFGFFPANKVSNYKNFTEFTKE